MLFDNLWLPDRNFRLICKNFHDQHKSTNIKDLFQKIDKTKDFAIGKHSEKGILIMHGDHVKKDIIKKANLEDIVPTILHYFDIPVPKNIDGKILNFLKLYLLF